MTANTVHDEAGSTRPLVVDRSLAVWLGIFGACLVAFALRPYLDWVKAPPPELLLPIADSVNAVADWLVHSGVKVLFHGLSWLLGWAMAWLQGFLLWLPWPAAILAVGALAWAAGGFGLAAFASATLVYMLLVGYWDESMKTLSLVGVSVPLSLALGLALGILGFKSRTAARIVEPTLDVMQTVPAFAYLIPFLWLFGFGPVVGLIAGIIYATPPMVLNVMLGLQRVPPHLVEAGRMAGCTRRQLLWRVQIPEALPTVMLGVNQTIMAALSIVIIAAVIGGFADIGWELLSTLRKAHFGPSLLSGLVIALVAMVLDRVSLGFARPRLPRGKDPSPWRRHRLAGVTAIGCAVIVALAQFIPALHSFPEAWVVKQPAVWLNEGAHWLVITISPVIDAIKKHELGYHSNWHSVQPSPAMYLSTLGWDEGVAEFDRREGSGLDSIDDCARAGRVGDDLRDGHRTAPWWAAAVRRRDVRRVRPVLRRAAFPGLSPLDLRLRGGHECAARRSEGRQGVGPRRHRRARDHSGGLLRLRALSHRAHAARALDRLLMFAH
jgi:ABC-type proline/glycine betaine transport system permease subunit